MILLEAVEMLVMMAARSNEPGQFPWGAMRQKVENYGRNNRDPPISNNGNDYNCRNFLQASLYSYHCNYTSKAN
jgi:hypothetical protein